MLSISAFQDFAMIESLQNRIRELEAELSEMKQIAESTQEVSQMLHKVIRLDQEVSHISKI